jgi:hypothetical protein
MCLDRRLTVLEKRTLTVQTDDEDARLADFLLQAQDCSDPEVQRALLLWALHLGYLKGDEVERARRTLRGMGHGSAGRPTR